MFGLIPWRKERGVEATRPEHPLALFRNEFDNLFDWVARSWPMTPGFKLEETDKEVLLKLDAPGFEPSDFDVQVTADYVQVRAEHREAKEEGKETNYRHFEHTLSLPAAADPEKVEAHYRNGVLELRLAKSPESIGRKIEVKA